MLQGIRSPLLFWFIKRHRAQEGKYEVCTSSNYSGWLAGVSWFSFGLGNGIPRSLLAAKTLVAYFCWLETSAVAERSQRIWTYKVGELGLLPDCEWNGDQYSVVLSGLSQVCDYHTKNKKSGQLVKDGGSWYWSVRSFCRTWLLAAHPQLFEKNSFPEVSHIDDTRKGWPEGRPGASVWGLSQNEGWKCYYGFKCFD